MSGLLTTVTEVVTGLGASGAESLEEALGDRPSALSNVDHLTWGELRAAFLAGEHARSFQAAWENGRAFFEADDGLRGRVPLCIEWKGPHRQPGYDNLPVDLRIDHVFLVSCKYRSKILTNSSPLNLFHRRLVERSVNPTKNSWYEIVAPEEYREFYSAVRTVLDENLLPGHPDELDPEQLALIRNRCAGTWPTELREPWAKLSHAVAVESARRWNLVLDTSALREEMLWRLLRLGPAPYFVLGSGSEGPVRLRIATPWDWRQHFRMGALNITAVEGGQPVVEWAAELEERATGRTRQILGHVEIRWAHGRFSTVEAKVYLDTPIGQVPGYFHLDGTAAESDDRSTTPQQPLRDLGAGRAGADTADVVEQVPLWSED